MLNCDRIDVSEGIDVSKTSEWDKSVIIVTIDIFLNKGFKFQPYVCNTCHDLLMMYLSFSSIYILNIKRHWLSLYY